MATISLATAEAPLILALDLGTSSLRGLVYDAGGRAVTGAETQLRYELRATPDGGAEVDAPPLIDLLVRCLDGALAGCGERASDLAAVACSCFWHSLLGLDASGEPVTPLYMWGDTRSGEDVRQLRREYDQAAVHDRTGCRFHSSYWPAKLRWLARTAPDTFHRVARWCSFGEYVMQRLHGDAAVTISMASGTGLLDIRRLTWDDEMLQATGLTADQLNPLIDRDVPASGLKSEYAKRWPALARIPWYPALGDGGCANVGSGAVGTDRIALTIGTSGAMRVVAPFPDLTIPERLWAYRLDRERYVVGGSLSNGGNLLAWLARLSGIELTSTTLARLDRMPPDSHGLTILPFLAGERAPKWNDAVTGVVAGLTQATTHDDLLRAGMEAVAYRFALVYEMLRPLISDRHIMIANGAALLRSPVWLQIMADVLGQDIATLAPTDEASGRGAAVLALQTLGVIDSLVPTGKLDPTAGNPIFHPDRANAEIYGAALARHVRLESLLFSDDHAWDEAPAR